MKMPEAAKVFRAVKASIRRTEWARKRRNENLRLYLGPYYGPDGFFGSDATNEIGKPRRSPINLIAQTVHNLHALLCPEAVRNDFTAKQSGLSGEALKLGLAVDHLWKKLKVARQVVAPCIIDALLGPYGVCIVGSKSGGKMIMVNGEPYDQGEDFVERIDLEDHIIDNACRNWNERLFEGHRYRVPKEMALDSGLFAGFEDVINGLETVGQTKGSGEQTNVAEHMSKRYEDDRDALVEQIELMDLTLYLGDQAIDVTIPAQDLGPDAPYLLQREYQGPPGGRYPVLWFNDVPNNAIPLPYVNPFLDLHESADKIGAKMIRQILRTKRVLAYNRDASDDAQAVLDKDDGQSVGVDDVKSITNVDLGGVVADNYQAVEWVMSHWNNSAGQVQMLGGGQPTNGGNKTATGAQLQQTNATNRLGKLDERVEMFMTEITEKLAFSLVHDPLVSLPVTIRQAGGAPLDTVYSAETRRGGFLDFNFAVRSIRVKNVPPEVRAARLIDLITKAAPAALEMAVQGAVKFAPLMMRLGQELDFHDLDQFFNDPDLQAAVAQALAPTLQGAQPGQPTPPAGPPIQPNRGQPTMGPRRSAMQTGQPAPV